MKKSCVVRARTFTEQLTFQKLEKGTTLNHQVVTPTIDLPFGRWEY